MVLSEFVLSILGSWVASHIPIINEKDEQDIPDLNKYIQNEDTLRLFKIYDIFHDLEEIIDYLDDPVGYLLVEKEPSSFYRMTSVVLESKSTGEWFAFYRGSSFQSNGGSGEYQAKNIVRKFMEEKIPIGVWSIDQKKLNGFESGKILWLEIKNEIIPLKSTINEKSEEWEFVQESAKKIMKDI